MAPSPRPSPLISIQLLRAAACLLVLLHHARNPKDWMFSPLAGWDFTSGVQIFFVISGFIMYAAARQERPGEFMRRRLIRIAPLYAIATLIWTAWLGAHGLPVTDLGHLAMSLLIIPHPNPIHPDLIWPVLTPGWTLCYEMAFYLLFAVGLAVRRVVAVTAGVILPLVAVGFAFDPKGAIPHAFTDPILLAFVAGIAIAWIHERVSLARAWPLALLGAGVLAAHATPWLQLSMTWIVAASAALVAGALALEPYIGTRRLAGLRAVGDASYAIYLFHTLILAQVLWTGHGLSLTGWPQFLLLAGAGVALSVAAGLVLHRWVERPMLRALLRLGQPGSVTPRLDATPAAADAS
jgi:exopolysaccharide production protein ExoZ